MPALSIADLTVRHGAATAVRSASWQAEPGCVTAVVGPNGAGKTSTVEACVGLLRGWSGTISILGSAVSPASGPRSGVRSRIGVMLQDGGLYGAARMLDLARHIASLYPTSDDPEVLLAALGLDPSTRTPIRRLSGGEQQRVRCALSLIGRPELVFLDEPTAGLDVAGRRTVHELVRDRCARGTAVVLTTHQADDVERLADAVVVMVAGAVRATGTLDALLGRDDSVAFRGPAHADLTLLAAALPEGSTVTEERPGRYRASAPPTPLVLGAIASWCGQHGVGSTGLSVGRRSLDDLLLDLAEDASSDKERDRR